MNRTDFIIIFLNHFFFNFALNTNSDKNTFSTFSKLHFGKNICADIFRLADRAPGYKPIRPLFKYLTTYLLKNINGKSTINFSAKTVTY